LINKLFGCDVKLEYMYIICSTSDYVSHDDVSVNTGMDNQDNDDDDDDQFGMRYLNDLSVEFRE
jgi:hypothetical protein